MHFPGRKTYVFVVGKVHFQKSDISAISKVNVYIVFRNRVHSFSKRVHSFSENLQFGVEIHGVFENVPGAAAFCIIFACQTVEIHVFLSSPTWNLMNIYPNPTILVRSKRMGSCVLCKYLMCVCSVCMLCMYVMYVCHVCHVCMLCMHVMHAHAMHAWYVCMVCMHGMHSWHVCMLCMHVM